MNLYIRGNSEKPVDPPLIPSQGAMRRMTRWQRYTCEKAFAALNSANIGAIGGIYAATALGCQEDTEAFLAEIQQDAGALRSPLPFMRSTHNTMAGQLALLLGVTGPNITYSQEVFGLHSALLNAKLDLGTYPDKNVLVFASDERTELLQQLVERVIPERPVVLSEGAEAFVIGTTARKGDRAKITNIVAGREGDGSSILKAGILRDIEGYHVLWASGPDDGSNLAIPPFATSERYDERIGIHGSRTAEALVFSVDRINSGEMTRPCAIVDLFNGQEAMIVVEPC